MGSTTSPNYYFGNTIKNTMDVSLHIDEDGSIGLGDDFVISVVELRACIKAIRDIAKQEYPEDFL